MERIPLHSWEMEFSIQYHVTINSQLKDQNSIRYYIIYSMPALPSIDNTEVRIGKTPVTGCQLVREWEAFTPCAAPNV
jgi:hypothetical protein